jgi:hypothetical protein
VNPARRSTAAVAQPGTVCEILIHRGQVGNVYGLVFPLPAFQFENEAVNDAVSRLNSYLALGREKRRVAFGFETQDGGLTLGPHFRSHAP